MVTVPARGAVRRAKHRTKRVSGVHGQPQHELSLIDELQTNVDQNEQLKKDLSDSQCQVWSLPLSVNLLTRLCGQVHQLRRALKIKKLAMLQRPQSSTQSTELKSTKGLQRLLTTRNEELFSMQ